MIRYHSVAVTQNFPSSLATLGTRREQALAAEPMDQPQSFDQPVLQFDSEQNQNAPVLAGSIAQSDLQTLERFSSYESIYPLLRFLMVSDGEDSIDRRHLPQAQAYACIAGVGVRSHR
eukprot:SAG31_NODE_9598_length_1253_cov_1.039861_1_plen_118_part_00